MALIKFSPIFLLSGLMIYGLDLVVAAPLATIYAAVIAKITEKHNFDEIVENGFKAVKEMIMVFFILMFAYAVAEAFIKHQGRFFLIDIKLTNRS